MRVAVISDIHGNYKALEAFLSYIEEHSVDAIIGLGDYVTDSPYPQRTLSMIYEMEKKYPCYLLRGNREEYLLDNRGQDQGWHICSPNGALYYTYRNVTPADLDWMEAMPSERVLQLKDCPALTMCHGAPGVIRGNFQFDELFGSSPWSSCRPAICWGDTLITRNLTVYSARHILIPDPWECPSTNRADMPNLP